MSLSASSRRNSKRRLTQAAWLLLAGLTTPLGAIEPDPNIVEIVGPQGQSAGKERQVVQRFGPVSASDTLWRIATATRPDPSITVYQMMYALYQKNPHAFERGNIHQLSRGSILLIPTLEEASFYSDRQASIQLAADQEILDQEREALNAQQQIQPEQQPAPRTSSSGNQTRTESPVPVATPAPVDPMAEAEAERERKLYEVNMRQLKSDLADSQGSIETLEAQNQALLERVDSLTSNISELMAQLESERTESAAVLQQLSAQAQAAQKEVLDLKENPPTASLWLWLLSGGLALVFGLIGWLLLRHRQSSESAQAAQPVTPVTQAPTADALPAEEPEPSAEPEEDVLLDLGLDAEEPEDAPIDLGTDDDEEMPDLVDLDSLDIDEEPEEEVEGLLARDAELTEPHAEEPQIKPEESEPEMQEIQTLDLDLDAEGGELTQEALDALAGMEDLDGDEFDASEPEGLDDLEEAFDAIGQPEPAVDDDELDVMGAIMSGQDEDETLNSDLDGELEALTSDLADEIDAAAQTEVVEEAPKATGAEDDDEELDIDALLAESSPEPEQALEPAADDEQEIDIDALLNETQQETAVPEPEPDEIDIDALLDENQSEQADGDELDGLEAELALEEAENLDAPELESDPEQLEQPEDDLDALVAELDAVSQVAEAEPDLDEVLDDSDDELLELDSLLDESGEEAPLSEQAIEDETLDISNLLADEEHMTSEEPAQAERPLTADELEQEFDLDNLADELLADEEADVELDLDMELESALDKDADDSLPDDIAAQLLEPEKAEPVDEEYVDIDSLLAEADSAGESPDEDHLLPGELDGANELEAEDEVAAKLDLARAYIEIGDKEVASQLLQEIVQDETGTHKAEAQALLDRLA